MSIGAEGLAEEVLAEDLVEVVCKLAGADCSRRNGVGDVGDSGVLAGNELGYAFNDRVVLDAAVNGLELVYIDHKGLSAFTGCSFAAAEAVGYLYVLRLGVSENAGCICLFSGIDLAEIVAVGDVGVDLVVFVILGCNIAYNAADVA